MKTNYKNKIIKLRFINSGEQPLIVNSYNIFKKILILKLMLCQYAKLGTYALK